MLGKLQASQPISVKGRKVPFDGSEPLFIGYSVRNRRFTKEFFEAAGRLAVENFSELLVAIFDYPYAYNDAGLRGETMPTARDIERAVEIGNERARMVTRALSKVSNLKYHVARWPEFDTAWVATIRAELTQGLYADSALRAELESHSSAWALSAGEKPCDEFLGFQISELPVLIDIYYSRGFLVDLYPDSITDFFFQLEDGRWFDTLPLASKAAEAGRLSCLRPSANNRETNCLRRGYGQPTSHEASGILVR